MIKKNIPYIRVIITVVIMDLISKLWAFNTLPFQENVGIIGQKVSFYLTYNEAYLSRQARVVLDRMNPVQAILQWSTIILIVNLYIIFISRLKMKPLQKWVYGIILFVGGVFILDVMNMYANVDMPIWSASLIAKTSVLMWCIILFFMITNKVMKYGISFIIVTGIGNGLNHFYAPYKVIDFISIEGSYELLRIGVFNIADLSYDVGMLIIIGYAAYSFILSLIKSTLKLKENIIGA
jgi:lipoprotein signal peptidase